MSWTSENFPDAIRMKRYLPLLLTLQSAISERMYPFTTQRPPVQIFNRRRNDGLKDVDVNLLQAARLYINPDAPGDDNDRTTIDSMRFRSLSELAEHIGEALIELPLRSQLILVDWFQQRYRMINALRWAYRGFNQGGGTGTSVERSGQSVGNDNMDMLISQAWAASTIVSRGMTPAAPYAETIQQVVLFQGDGSSSSYASIDLRTFTYDYQSLPVQLLGNIYPGSWPNPDTVEAIPQPGYRLGWNRGDNTFGDISIIPEPPTYPATGARSVNAIAINIFITVDVTSTFTYYDP